MSTLAFDPSTIRQLEKSVTFRNIVVATDFSPASNRAMLSAAVLAEGNDGQLFAVHVVQPKPRRPITIDPLPISLDPDYQKAKTNLARLAASQFTAHLHHEEIVERGPVWDVISDVLYEKQADLLVLGTHGRAGLRKIVLGSVAEELFRRAPCPVLTVGPFAEPARGIRKVLFATDFGPSSLLGLPYALDFANREGGEIILLHLVSPFPVEYVGPAWYPGTDVLEREEASRKVFLKRLQALLPSTSALKCKVEHLVAFHFVSEGIVNTAKRLDVDLIVMGVRQSGTGIPRFAARMPWAVAHEVVCKAECPVLTVRA